MLSGRKKAQWLACIISMILIGSALAMTADIRNDHFQSCTTKAYGWPMPWKIDCCLCDGGEIIYPIFNIIVNISLVFGFGVVMFIITGMLLKLGNSQRSKT